MDLVTPDFKLLFWILLSFVVFFVVGIIILYLKRKKEK